MNKKNALFIGLIAISIFMCPAMAPAAPYENCNLPAKSGLVAASAALTIPYFVAKMGYGFAGTLTAGAINFFSFRYAEPTAEKIAFKSAGGDWYITPDHLLGEKKLQFVGPVE
jgi:uncharacterized membrane protein